MQWTEVTVLTTTQASEMVSAILEQAGSKGVMIEDKNDVYANQRPEGQWDIIDEAIAERIGDDVRVTGYYPRGRATGKRHGRHPRGPCRPARAKLAL